MELVLKHIEVELNDPDCGHSAPAPQMPHLGEPGVVVLSVEYGPNDDPRDACRVLTSALRQAGVQTEYV